ncbi:MAG: helix-turn-helix domain-containing protein [Nanoarchaeota archaeon]|nr:helix-turn-helix domain-containing protein [Nanoarchaeota archaeon]
MEENISKLVLAGLSEKEALVYLDLLQHGESQSGKICERTKIPSSHIYQLIYTLQEKGLAAYKVVNNKKVFHAADPEALAHLFEEKEKVIREEKESLLQFISKLKVLPKQERLTDFKYFSGIRGIKSLYTEIMNSWKSGDTYYIASAPLESFRKLEGFFTDIVHKKRIKDKVKLKMIVNADSRKWGEIRAKMPLTEVRYVQMNSRTEYGVLNDYFFLITYGEEPYGLLIKDKNFAGTYKATFELLWQNIAK